MDLRPVTARFLKSLYSQSRLTLRSAIRFLGLKVVTYKSVMLAIVF